MITTLSSQWLSDSSYSSPTQTLFQVSKVSQQSASKRSVRKSRMRERKTWLKQQFEVETICTETSFEMMKQQNFLTQIDIETMMFIRVLLFFTSLSTALLCELYCSTPSVNSTCVRFCFFYIHDENLMKGNYKEHVEFSSRSSHSFLVFLSALSAAVMCALISANMKMRFHLRETTRAKNMYLSFWHAFSILLVREEG